MHKINIVPVNEHGITNKVLVDGIELQGIRSATVWYSAGEIPHIDLEMLSTKMDVDAIAEAHLMIDIGSIQDAIRCINLQMRLDDDFRRAVIASTKSAIDEVRNKNQTDVIDDYALAKAIVARVFIGER